MLIELASGKFPYPANKSYIEMLEYITKCPSPNLPDNGLYTKELRSFIQFCLEKDGSKRASAIELLVLSLFRVILRMFRCIPGF